MVMGATGIMGLHPAVARASIRAPRIITVPPIPLATPHMIRWGGGSMSSSQRYQHSVYYLHVYERTNVTCKAIPLSPCNRLIDELSQAVHMLHAFVYRRNHAHECIEYIHCECTGRARCCCCCCCSSCFCCWSHATPCQAGLLPGCPSSPRE
jgi:hypothetical protein